MSHHLLNQALALFPSVQSKKFGSEWWQEVFEKLRQFLASHTKAERRELFRSAQEQSCLALRGLSHLYIRFFLHPCFEVFEAFWQDEILRSFFAGYFRVYARNSYGYSGEVPSGRRFKKQMEQLEIAQFARRYVGLLAVHYQFFSLRGEKDPTSKICFMTVGCIPSPESALRVFEKEEMSATVMARREFEAHLRYLYDHSYHYRNLFNVEFERDVPNFGLDSLQSDDLLSELEVGDFVLEIPKGIRTIHDYTRILSGTLKGGRWPSFEVKNEPTEARISTATRVRHESRSDLLFQLEEAHFGNLKRARVIDHGRLPIGLKVHCAAKKVQCIDFLREGNFSAHDAGTCFNLPPVGSVELAAEVFRNIEHKSGLKFLDSNDFQIQVCSPGKLNPRNAALLGIAYYLGSDRLRAFHPGDFMTSLYNLTGDRLIIYGAGVLDPNFQWLCIKNGAAFMTPKLPRVMERTRTDVLGCQSLRDIANVNLVATLLVHVEYEGYWQTLGEEFIAKLEGILESHFLSHLLNVNWVKEKNSPLPTGTEDELFYRVLEELSTYAFEEADRIAKAYEEERWTETRNGILFQIKDLLDEFKRKLELQFEEQYD